MRPESGFRGDAEAASNVVGYIISFAISALLFSHFLTSYPALIESPAKQTRLYAFSILANDIAVRMAHVDRVVDAEFEERTIRELRSRIRVPEHIAGGSYVVNLTKERVRVYIPNTTLEAYIPLNVTTSVTVRELGGVARDMEIFYNATSGGLDIRWAS